MSLPLDGQTAIVTGAATGIGEAIAVRLAASGATVAILDLDLAGAERVAAAIGGGGFALQADVTRSAEVERVVSTVLARTGRAHLGTNQ
jgi:NAD(P)-dependent dehydrogenase (short-subunit alcohol dehydrogenase family)